ncbi:CD48 antigen [Anabarilius grahami]|uniref:CD48 antigen n=1 Tax=Anabarilius grahami TaxID=495550 RepID=A0A3N0YVT2_ANAGA|nr:CD48 antigen [Anabarilius grahami]
MFYQKQRVARRAPAPLRFSEWMIALKTPSSDIPLVKLYLKSLRSALRDNVIGKRSPGMMRFMRNGDSKALFFGQNHGERSRIGVFGVDAVTPVSVTEGDSVTLNTQRDDEIEWRFGDKNILIAEIRQDNKITCYDDSADGRFKDRLKMDQNGSLTITNTRTTDSGLYTVTETRKTKTPLDTFSVTVYSRLPVPVILKYSPQCSSSSSSSSSESKSVLLCSVVDVSHVTLSWYKGSSLLSNISVSNLSISISLPLEVEHQDRNTYRCVLNNPISNQTKHLDISGLCSGCCCCGFTEAVIRLALSALVGVAGAVILVYEFRTRKLHQKKIVKNAATNTDQSDENASDD